MRLATPDIDVLREQVACIRIKSNTVTTKLEKNLSDENMRALDLGDTILAGLNVSGEYNKQTLGQLACATGIPTSVLYDCITSEKGEPEAVEVAKDRLEKAISSLEKRDIAA